MGLNTSDLGLKDHELATPKSNKSFMRKSQITELKKLGHHKFTEADLEHRDNEFDDDPFFMNNDVIEAQDVFRKVPQGRFQTLIIIIYTILYISTSTLAFNFVFFLMPQSYLCPLDANTIAP
jgi:hypothetical protein